MYSQLINTNTLLNTTYTHRFVINESILWGLYNGPTISVLGPIKAGKSHLLRELMGIRNEVQPVLAPWQEVAHTEPCEIDLYRGSINNILLNLLESTGESSYVPKQFMDGSNAERMYYENAFKQLTLWTQRICYAISDIIIIVEGWVRPTIYYDYAMKVSKLCPVRKKQFPKLILVSNLSRISEDINISTKSYIKAATELYQYEHLMEKYSEVKFINVRNKSEYPDDYLYSIRQLVKLISSYPEVNNWIKFTYETHNTLIDKIEQFGKVVEAFKLFDSVRDDLYQADDDNDKNLFYDIVRSFLPIENMIPCIIDLLDELDLRNLKKWIFPAAFNAILNNIVQPNPLFNIEEAIQRIKPFINNTTVKAYLIELNAIDKSKLPRGSRVMLNQLSEIVVGDIVRKVLPDFVKDYFKSYSEYPIEGVRNYAKDISIYLYNDDLIDLFILISSNKVSKNKSERYGKIVEYNWSNLLNELNNLKSK